MGIQMEFHQDLSCAKS